MPCMRSRIAAKAATISDTCFSSSSASLATLPLLHNISQLIAKHIAACCS